MMSPFNNITAYAGWKTRWGSREDLGEQNCNEEIGLPRSDTPTPPTPSQIRDPRDTRALWGQLRKDWG